MKYYFCLFFFSTIGFLHAQAGFEQYGVASYYADKFHGCKTASGELYNKEDLTCAHKTLPFGTLLRVTHLDTKNSVIVRVNDRGPVSKDRIIDLSRAAAEGIDLNLSGIAQVKVEIVNIEDLPMATTVPVMAEAAHPPETTIGAIGVSSATSYQTSATPATSTRSDPTSITLIAKGGGTTSLSKPAGTTTTIDKPVIATPVEKPATATSMSNASSEEFVTGVTFKTQATYRIELRDPLPEQGYEVQVLTMSSLDNSLKEIARLQQQAPGQVLITTDKTKGGNTVYKLGVGIFATKGEAEKMKNHLAKKGFPKCFIVKK